MISFRNCEIYVSVLFYVVTKFLCFVAKVMHKRQITLSSIPEVEDFVDTKEKWVPKKKHEVLKAKYKCLKKLFQVYDASVIGILPDAAEQYEVAEERRERKCRQKRSHRTKSDACAGTNEVYHGDVSISEEKASNIASTLMRDLTINRNCSCSTQMIPDTNQSITQSISPSISQLNEKSATKKNNATFFTKDCECTQTNFCNCANLNCHNLNFNDLPNTLKFNLNNINNLNHLNPLNNPQHPVPYLIMNEKHKPTRFQLFMQRLFGIRREKYKNSHMPSSGHVYAASENNLTHFVDRRRRRGLRFRRIRRLKKSHSEYNMSELNSSAILTYVQAIQRHCLMDTTARQCPIAGCETALYGIINYNDHLNLCHFPSRKSICHYCHEGFETDGDKMVHENQHLGINKLNSYSTSTTKSQRASITQTESDLSKAEIRDEKLKKIVSFFDKIVENDQLLTEIKKNRFSESNLQGSTKETHYTSKSEDHSETESSNSEKRSFSCGTLLRRRQCCPLELRQWASEPVKCQFCGESFAYRRQLSLHMDLEHRMHNKFSKFHSCAGITTLRPKSKTQLQFEAGKINVQTNDLHYMKTTTVKNICSNDTCSVNNCDHGSDVSVSCDRSSNFYDSNEELTQKLGHVGKARNAFSSYKWEPGTKIIRV